MRLTVLTVVIAINIAINITINISGCSTTELDVKPPPPPEPPAYLKVPHPNGFDISDLKAVMAHKDAPKTETIKTCDSYFHKLMKDVRSEDERERGVLELLRTDPVSYHWCFYGKVLDLEESMQTSTYLDERQRNVLTTYSFLAPVAKAFRKVYQDSRYLRWAVMHYKRISKHIFFRNLELSPEGTLELVQIPNPFGLWREPAGEDSVLQKYGIAQQAGPQPSPSPQINP